MSEVAVTHREGRLQIAGDMTIYAAVTLKDELFTLVPDCEGDIDLDLSAVSTLDTAGVQIMLMLRRLAQSRGAAFHVRSPSAAVIEVLELCGMQKLIGDTERAS